MLYLVTPALSARALTPRLLEDLAVNIVQEISSGLIHAVEDFVEKDLDVEGELPRVLATEAGSGYQFNIKISARLNTGIFVEYFNFFIYITQCEN